MKREEFSALALSSLDEVAAYARRLTGSAADADDLVQETFARAFRSWRDLRERRACRAWLFRIARNVHLNRRRYVSSRPELHLVDEGRAAEHASFIPAERVERLAAHDLEAALERLPAEQRDAVLLCDLWGFEYEEIASIVECPVGTVRSRISRGRERLAVRLAAWSTRARGRES